MSTITFSCTSEQKEALKTGVWEILRNHYYTTVHPNTNVEYENEGKAVYLARLDTLMKEQLCQMECTDEGLVVEFDSTEDAGFAITDEVYHTLMGYSDDGLTWVDPIFEAIVQKFPEIPFEADVVSADEWVYEENHFSYDGKTLLKNDCPIDEQEF